MRPDTGTAPVPPPGSSSLRRSLLRALALPILIALLTGGTFAYLIAEQVVSRAYDQSLLNLAERIADRVVVAPDLVGAAATDQRVLAQAGPKGVVAEPAVEIVIAGKRRQRVVARTAQQRGGKMRVDVEFVVIGSADQFDLLAPDTELQPENHVSSFRNSALFVGPC